MPYNKQKKLSIFNPNLIYFLFINKPHKPRVCEWVQLVKPPKLEAGGTELISLSSEQTRNTSFPLASYVSPLLKIRHFLFLIVCFSFIDFTAHFLYKTSLSSSPSLPIIPILLLLSRSMASFSVPCPKTFASFGAFQRNSKQTQQQGPHSSISFRSDSKSNRALLSGSSLDNSAILGFQVFF